MRPSPRRRGPMTTARSPSQGRWSAVPACAGMTSISCQLPELGADLGRALDHGFPRDVVGALDELGRLRRPEIQPLDAGLALALALRLDRRLVLGIEPFEPHRRVVEHL